MNVKNRPSGDSEGWLTASGRLVSCTQFERSAALPALASHTTAAAVRAPPACLRSGRATWMRSSPRLFLLLSSDCPVFSGFGLGKTHQGPARLTWQDRSRAPSPDHAHLP